MGANNTQNVSTGKGIAGGYFFSAPRNATTLAFILTLSDFSVSLTDAFKNLGYIAADGITEGETADTQTDTDMNGDAINTSRSNRVETEKVKLVETKADSLAEQYGHGNVSDVAGLITVHHNNADREHRIYVAELVMKDGRRWRKIVPDGQVTDVADLTINSKELLGREVTIGCNVYTYTLDGVTYTDTVIDFMESTETPAPTCSAITLSNVTLSPSFASGTTEYTGTSTSTSTTVTATKTDGDDTVSIVDGNGNTYASGSAVPLVAGTNHITVKVEDDDSPATNNYRFAITKS